MQESPEIASLAALIGDRTRAAVLTALMADRALSATELAQIAGVAKPTISTHLDKLLRADLVKVDRQGRHKYFRLSGPDVAATLESLTGLAFRTGTVSRRGIPADPALRKARVCYDHLAGELGVQIYEALWRVGALKKTAAEEIELTVEGERRFADVGIDVPELRARRRPLCRACLDWTERRHHLAGALGAALLRQITLKRWARQAKDSRALHFSALGEAAARTALGS